MFQNRDIWIGAPDWRYSVIKSFVINNGCATAPTARSESARPQSKNMDGERRVGVFHTACNTSVLPIIDVNARTMFTAQFTTTTFCMASLACCSPLDQLPSGTISTNRLVISFVSLEKRIAFQRFCLVFDTVQFQGRPLFRLIRWFVSNFNQR